MFEIFTKKHFLADLLGNFVDIHNHILPGIDDGAKTVEDSVELIRGFGELGINRFVATPHILQPLYPNTAETINKAHDQLMDRLMDLHMTDVGIEPAAEHMIDDSFETLVAADGVMPINARYLLVEMSYLQPSLNFEDAITGIARKGYTPILAHPERYMFLHKNRSHYRKFENLGILFQLNILSLGNYYGEGVQKVATSLLLDGQYSFMASDAHNVKHLEAIRDIKLNSKVFQAAQQVIRNTIECFF